MNRANGDFVFASFSENETQARLPIHLPIHLLIHLLIAARACS